MKIHVQYSQSPQELAHNLAQALRQWQGTVVENIWVTVATRKEIADVIECLTSVEFETVGEVWSLIGELKTICADVHEELQLVFEPAPEPMKPIPLGLSNQEVERVADPGGMSDLIDMANKYMTKFNEANDKLASLKDRVAESNQRISQACGKALGYYPWYKDDQKNFPGATEADGVCVGEHVAETIVDELAKRYVETQRVLDQFVTACDSAPPVELLQHISMAYQEAKKLAQYQIKDDTKKD